MDAGYGNATAPAGRKKDDEDDDVDVDACDHIAAVVADDVDVDAGDAVAATERSRTSMMAHLPSL